MLKLPFKCKHVNQFVHDLINANISHLTVEILLHRKLQTCLTYLTLVISQSGPIKTHL